MKKPIALIILDGFALIDETRGNAVAAAQKPFFDRLYADYPHTKLGASGEDVGLPHGQMGNSEVGHLNIGAGRIVYQELTRISKAIQDGDFFTNPVLLEAMQNAKAGKALHLMGLLSDGGVHSHIEHLEGLLDLASKSGAKKVYLHAFLDGRDTPPKSARVYIERIESHMAKIGLGQIATVSGRYYAMDRDNRWERVERAYRAVVEAKGAQRDSAIDCLEKSYEAGINDEFVEPALVLRGYEGIKNGDSVILFNFRPDRGRELTRAIVDDNFTGFERTKVTTQYVTFTQYDETIKNVNIAFEPTKLENTLGAVLAKNGKSQLRIAETEKYPHVTFFFNGGREEKYEEESRILVHSPKVATYDLQPEMSAYEVTERLIEDLRTDPKDVIILNFANGDMVGHTGVFEAAVKAVETVDQCLSKIVPEVLAMDGSLLITADHGNAEQMLAEDGTPFTAHTTNRVPLILVDQYKDIRLREDGRLSDIAPTILEKLNIEKPIEMLGNSLIIK